MIQWWCSAQSRPFTWEWIPYPGVWLAAAIPSAAYLWVTSRSENVTTRRHRVLFLSGMAVLWLASDWPLGTLGSGYLASAHTAQFILYTFVGVPLLMLGTPTWLARRFVNHLHIRRLLKWLSGSLVLAAIIYTVGFVLTHSPGVVDTLRSSQIGSFAMDLTWLALGAVLWMPILSPVPEHRANTHFAKIGYLLAATALMSIVPSTLILFVQFPIYQIYELAPRIGDMTPVTDQQIAGVLMRVGALPVVAVVVGVLFVRWVRSVDSAFAVRTAPAQTSPAERKPEE